MNTELQFTRYLYGKDEVEISLMTNLLNRTNDAIFWADELFHSGFVISQVTYASAPSVFNKWHNLC